jgi:hypothetical protein
MDITIRQLEDNKGNKINKHQEIIKYVQNFNSDLYKSQDDNIEHDKIDSLINVRLALSGPCAAIAVIA